MKIVHTLSPSPVAWIGWLVLGLGGGPLICNKNVRTPLANSPDWLKQHLCGKICSHRGVNPDRNRIIVLPCSTIMRSTSGFCRLIVISPTVSDPFRTPCGHLFRKQLPWVLDSK